MKTEKETARRHKINIKDMELALERSLAARWVRDDLLILALRNRLTPDTLQESFNRFQQENPIVKMDMHSMWPAVLQLRINLKVLAFPLSEASLELQKRKQKIRSLQ